MQEYGELKNRIKIPFVSIDRIHNDTKVQPTPDYATP